MGMGNQLQFMMRELEGRRMTPCCFLQHKEYAGLARGSTPGGGGSTDLQESCTQDCTPAICLNVLLLLLLLLSSHSFIHS